MNTAAWTIFTKRIPVKADIPTLYHAWTTREGLERWFLREAVFTAPDGLIRPHADFAQAGDAYLWRWHGYADDVFEAREVTEANGTDLFSFRFSGNCLVRVQLTPYDQHTLVEITQREIPEDNNPSTNLYVGCGEGWTFYLANLKSIYEGGIDLRNRDMRLQGVVVSS